MEPQTRTAPAGLLVIGDGPGAAEVARLAAERGVPVTTGPRVATGARVRCLVAPRARVVLPAWWRAPAVLPGTSPGTVIIVGGGHGGVEAAQRWAAGAGRVLLVEAEARLLPDWDEEVAAHVGAQLAALGVTVHCGCRAVALEAAGHGVMVRLRRRGATHDAVEGADLAVPALGLRPDLAGLGLEGTRALADRLGFVQVDSRLETAEPGLHALGAAVALPLTPAVVARQAAVVASCAAGGSPAPVRYNLLARVIDGKVGALTAGLTADGARARGFRVAEGRAGDERAWVACVRDAETGATLGVHAAGPGAAAVADAATALLEAAAPPAPPAGAAADGDVMTALLGAAHAAAKGEARPDD